MLIDMTVRCTASAVLELEDDELECFGPDDVRRTDLQLVEFCDALRAACAAHWGCAGEDVRCTVQREHSVPLGCQWWRVTASCVRSGQERLGVTWEERAGGLRVRQAKKSPALGGA